MHPIIVQQPQVTLDTTTLENTFGTVGQSMLQLARAQDQTNRYLQEHLQQGQINMQVHTQEPSNNWPPQPTKGILITYLPAYQYMMEVIGKISFHGLNA